MISRKILAAMGAVALLASAQASAQTCSMPQTCGAGQASSWNGSSWICLPAAATAAAPACQIVGAGTVNMNDGGSGGVHCAGFNFPNTPGKTLIPNGNIVYPSAIGQWGAWAINFRSMTSSSGTVCIDTGQKWSGPISAEWVYWTVCAY